MTDLQLAQHREQADHIICARLAERMQPLKLLERELKRRPDWTPSTKKDQA